MDQEEMIPGIGRIEEAVSTEEMPDVEEEPPPEPPKKKRERAGPARKRRTSSPRGTYGD